MPPLINFTYSYFEFDFCYVDVLCYYSLNICADSLIMIVIKVIIRLFAESYVFSGTSNVVSVPGLVKWDLWWTKWRWSRFSPSSSVSPVNHYSTVVILHPHITRGRHNRTVNGRGAGWTQCGPHPPLYANKKKRCQ
jgi:hypothetical protein